MRDGIATSLNAYFADKLKEGVNNYALSNGRKLKYTYAVDRKIDSGHVQVARDAYALTDATAPFDDLLRVKYELAKTPWKKLDGEAALAASRMITSKPAAPVLVVD